MTEQRHPAPLHDDSSRWQGARPELIIAAIVVGAVGLAALAVAGWSGLAVVAVGVAALSVVVLRGLVPRSADQTVRKAKEKPVAGSIGGYAQRRFVVGTSISSEAFYESDLRPALEHLLAARLAEHHGINLYAEPSRARAAFCQTRADESVWRWIDPAQAVPMDVRAAAAQGGGIPRRTLARLVYRLEHL
ncbi:MAG TPA: hypothetical protein VK817_14115 [Trebonia sp.]|jgi:hypothetical protein|nr:hypothetical protein [Trebonia sp.]